MKKNVFSRTLAVLGSTAVLGAASMLSVNAAGETLGLSSTEGKAGETVTLYVNVGCNNNFESLDVIVGWDASTGLTSDVAKGEGDCSVASSNGDGYVTVVGYGSAAIADGAVAKIDFTIPADAAEGTTYNVGIDTVNVFASMDGEVEVAPTGGTITVVGEATEAPTDEPTDAPTEAPTEAKKAAEGSPKTGVAGVAVAVAGLVTAGAAAVVLRKKH